jgi:hypothetical protein
LFALLSGQLLSNFSTTLSLAQSFRDTPSCTAPSQNDCIAQVSATVTGLWITHGSKGSIHYHVGVAAPSASASEQNVDVGKDEYYSVGVGSSVAASVWRFVIVDVAFPDGVVKETVANPLSGIGSATFGLLVPGFAVGLLFAGVMVVVSRKTPDDLLRDATYTTPQPPRGVPDGMLIAVMAWATTRAMLAYGAALTLEAVVLTQIGHTHPIAIRLAPPLMIGTVIISAALVYWWLYGRFRDYLSTGWLKEIPVNSETILRGRNGPYAAKVVYSLSDGRQAKKTIRSKWWRLIHRGTVLRCIASPDDGKIWRVLGMIDDAGQPVY